MVDVFKVADLLVSHAVRTHGDEVDLIGYYGSRAQGVAAPESDLDIFYIPADGKSPPVAQTVLIEGMLFDFWPIRWHTMEGFATGQNRGWSLAPAIVHHAKVLHARSPEQVARLDALKQKVLDLQAPQARPQMIRRATEVFPRVLGALGNLRLAAAGADLADARHAGWQVILAAWECLALANQTLFGRGWRNLVAETPRLAYRPADLEQLITCISTSEDVERIAAAGERLALETRRVLRELQESVPCERAALERFGSAYPEIQDEIGKVLRACQRQEPVAASAAAWSAQYDMSLMLASLRNGVGYSDFNLYSECSGVYRQIGLPDLMGSTCGDLAGLAEQAGLLDEAIRRWLRSESVSLGEFATVEEFERSLEKEPA